MKLNVFKSLLALLFLASILPGVAYQCNLPCAMSQQQMAACAKACASMDSMAGAKATLGRGSCVSVQAKAAQDMLNLGAAASDAPAFKVLPAASIVAATPLQSTMPLARLLRGPPASGNVESALHELPSQNAPPVTI